MLETDDSPEAVMQRTRKARVEILLRMGRTQEARRAIEGLVDENSDAAGVELLLGRLDLQEALSFSEAAPGRSQRLESARRRFREARRLDPLGGAHSRQATYWLAKVQEHLGKPEEALALYNRAARQFGDSPEGVAAALAEADLELDALRLEQAVAGYRRVVESMRNPAASSNPLLPASVFRKRMVEAHQRFIAEQDFEDALTLVDLLESVFSHLECVQLRAKTHDAWGRSLAEAALREDPWNATEVNRGSRFHFRAAGRSFEDLARLRFASRFFTDDLMSAAESYFAGQGYASAARVLREYLQHEARRRNARALLLLGRSLLARNEPEKAIHALAECAEMHPRDAAVYQARLEQARAHRQLGEFEKAEQQLLKNLVGDTLTPDSMEWRDSLFALGRLMFDAGRYDAAISRLEEAVARYPDADEFLLAKYTIARSHHNASAEPARRLREAKTENERQKNRSQLEHYLTRAHDTYVDVQRRLALNGLSEGNTLHHTLLRNCYMMQGSVLFELRQFEKARQAFANVVTYYQHEPFVLEAFVQIANCSRRLDDPVKAKANIAQAMLKLKELPTDADYRVSTNFTRQQWGLLLA
ncbi:MAG: tetratricopeptide repeat protein, partial [Planctomycetota bacterium]